MREVSFYGKRSERDQGARRVSKHEMKPSLEVVGGVLQGRAGRVLSFLLLRRRRVCRSSAYPLRGQEPSPRRRHGAHVHPCVPLSLSLSLSLLARAPSTVRQPPFVWTLVAHQTVTFKHFRGKSFQSWTGAGEGGGRDRSEASSATLRLVRLLEPRSRHGKVRPVGELSRRKTELRVSNVKESRRSPASSGCPALPPPSKGRALP